MSIASEAAVVSVALDLLLIHVTSLSPFSIFAFFAQLRLRET